MPSASRHLTITCAPVNINTTSIHSIFSAAEAYVHSKSHQHGQLRLKQALHAKGVSEDISRDFLPSREQELSSAAAVLQKKFKQPADNLPDKQKQMRFLAYRGFDMDTIQAVMKVDWSEDADWDREL